MINVVTNIKCLNGQLAGTSLRVVSRENNLGVHRNKIQSVISSRHTLCHFCGEALPIERPGQTDPSLSQRAEASFFH